MQFGLGASLHHSITPSLHHSITPSLHHSAARFEDEDEIEAAGEPIGLRPEGTERVVAWHEMPGKGQT
jgi:hypothetical protein